MENLTLGQISIGLLFIVELAGTIGAIMLFFKRTIKKQLQPIEEEIKALKIELSSKIENVDVNQCRNYLVDFIADVAQGIEKEDTQIKRAYDVHDHYINDLHKNSYVEDKWKKLMK